MSSDECKGLVVAVALLFLLGAFSVFSHPGELRPIAQISTGVSAPSQAPPPPEGGGGAP